MTISTITEPSVEPLSVADVKPHLRVEAADTDSDDLIADYIVAARQATETYLRKRLITQTVQIIADGFGDPLTCRAAMPLGIGPVQSVDQVQYLDATGSWVVMATSEYRLIDSQQPNLLAPAYGSIWPVPRVDLAVVKIDLIVGYGDAGTDVDADILQTMRVLVAHMFDNRVDGGAEAMAIRTAILNRLHAHRLWV